MESYGRLVIEIRDGTLDDLESVIPGFDGSAW